MFIRYYFSTDVYRKYEMPRYTEITIKDMRTRFRKGQYDEGYFLKLDKILKILVSLLRSFQNK